MAKSLLTKHGRSFREIDIETIPGLRSIIRDAGYTTVPLIHTEGAFIPGGYEELLEALEPETDNPSH